MSGNPAYRTCLSRRYAGKGGWQYPLGGDKRTGRGLRWPLPKASYPTAMIVMGRALSFVATIWTIWGGGKILGLMVDA